MTYATSFPSPETKVKSDKITIQPLGKATIEFSSIFFALNFDMQIEVSFPELSVESPEIRYPFRWMEHDKYLDGNKLKIDLGSNGANQFNLPSKYFKFVSASDDGVANGWLQKAIWQSKAVRDNVSKLKNSMGLLKLHFARSQVATAFMQFVYEIKESPSEEFFHSIESVDEWIRTAVALKNLANEIKEDEKKQGKATKELESKQTKKLADLKHLETQFANVFAKHPIATFASADVEHEIVGFARIWDLDLDPKNKIPTNENIVRRHLTGLVNSIRELRNTMASSSEFKIILESKANVLIWNSVPRRVPNDGLSGKKKDADSIYNQLFRVRTGVLFQDVKPEMRDSRGSGLRDKDDRSKQPQTQSSSDTPPKPAKQPEVQ